MMSELECLQNHPLFASLTEPELERAALHWELRNYPAGETFWWQGAPARELALVITVSPL